MTLSDYGDIAKIIGSITVFAVFIQLHFALKQFKADHERSRREKSVELLKDWSQSIKSEQTWARKLVEQFSSEQCRCLFNQQEFSISSKFIQQIEQYLDLTDEQKENKNDSILLTVSQVISLRWYVVSYLNLLESILVAWQYSVVDRDIIEHEFSFLFSPEIGHSALNSFRTAAGGATTYPAIEIFANHIAEKRRSILKEKAQIA